MGIEVDHYVVLGLPTGVQGARLPAEELVRAYRAKALELHPDKRPNDPNANEEFQKLQASYEILKDEKARKLFDHLLQVERKSKYNFKRGKSHGLQRFRDGRQ